MWIWSAETAYADLDAFRQAHDVERAGAAENGAEPAEGAGAAQRRERAGEGFRSRSVIDDVYALPPVSCQHFVGEGAGGIDDDMVGARLPGDGGLFRLETRRSPGHRAI